MKRAPTREAIDAAEARLAESRRRTRDGLHRARVAFRASLTRPSTLALAAGAAGAAGLIGLWLGRRPRRRAASRKVGAGVALAAYAAPFVQAMIVRYGKEGLSFLVDKVRAAWLTRAVRVAAEASKPSTPDGPAMGAPY